MKLEIYRRIIDHLVEVSRTGQGQVAPKRVLSGLWNQNATEGRLPEQHEMNLLLAALSVEQRTVLATMLQDQFVCGVFETLKALEEFQIEPFLDGYEGSPYHDFIGRVADDPWEWPNVPE
jgi:hypothetical protein